MSVGDKLDRISTPITDDDIGQVITALVNGTMAECHCLMRLEGGYVVRILLANEYTKAYRKARVNQI